MCIRDSSRALREARAALRQASAAMLERFQSPLHLHLRVISIVWLAHYGRLDVPFIIDIVVSKHDAIQLLVDIVKSAPHPHWMDGDIVGALPPGGELAIRFVDGVARLAQFPGTSFYQRIREKFGHLAV